MVVEFSPRARGDVVNDFNADVQIRAENGSYEFPAGIDILPARNLDGNSPHKDLASVLLFQVVLLDPRRVFGEQRNDVPTIDLASVGQDEIILHPPFHTCDGRVRRSTGTRRRTADGDVLEAKTKERHGQGLKTGDDDFALFTFLAGNAPAMFEDLEDHVIITDVIEPRLGTFPSHQPYFLAGVGVVDFPAESPLEKIPDPGRNQFSTQDDNPAAEGAGAFVVENLRNPG